MKYQSRPKFQVTAALIAALIAISLGYFIYGIVDWPTVIGVAVGVFLGIGFSKKHPENKDKETPSED